MPELPEVEALALDLKGRLDGHAIAKIHLAAFSALKTFDPPVQALEGTLVDDVTRHGKFLDIEASGLHLIFHLARAGWIRWKDELPAVPPRPNSKSGLAVRVVLDDQSGLDVTEAGTKKSLAAYVVRSPQDVRGIASLGPDPLDDAFTREILANILEDAGRSQIKGVLRHQGTIAGIGNAYSDEILHAAKMSPFKPANSLTVGRARPAVRRDQGRARRRRRAVPRSRRQRAEGREEDQPAGPRPCRREVPGLRRRRARGELRRYVLAVLPDLPDWRQASRRSQDVSAAQVGTGERHDESSHDATHRRDVGVAGRGLSAGGRLHVPHHAPRPPGPGAEQRSVRLRRHRDRSSRALTGLVEWVHGDPHRRGLGNPRPLARRAARARRPRGRRVAGRPCRGLGARPADGAGRSGTPSFRQRGRRWSSAGWAADRRTPRGS